MAGAKYAQEDLTDSAERPLKVCAEAGRKCVRNIHHYPVLSVEWISLVDSLKQLTRLVQLEGRMPVNSKVSEVQGRNADSEGTLWDQEQHENAIRILVEEAKVNLCLRMINDYKKWQYDAPSKRAAMVEAVQALETTESQLEQRCIQFEESLGVLLARAFTHVETLQLMDIPLLIEHCAMIFEGSKHVRPEILANTKMQETVVLYYFSSLMKHAEALNNAELLARTCELRLVQSAVNHVLTNIDARHPLELIVAIAEGLAAMADNEDFRTDWERFFVSPEGEVDREAKECFLHLESKVINVVLKEFPERKKDLRPALDFFKVVQRSLK